MYTLEDTVQNLSNNFIELIKKKLRKMKLTKFFHLSKVDLKNVKKTSKIPEFLGNGIITGKIE
jgi:hypothetical protein